MAEQRMRAILARVPFVDELLAALSAEQATVWLVGGCMRDLLLGRKPADVDLACEHPEPLARRFAGFVNGHVVPMDPERGIWRVAVAADTYLDFCKFRDEDILGDLRGRDFTLNAIALRLPTGDDDLGGLFDPFHGLDDLNNGVLRRVDPRAFRDDPARILRAFRFQSELGLTIEQETWLALQAEADRLPLIAPERLLAEWWKLCAGPFAAPTILRMDEAGVLTMLFPELGAAKGVTQNIFHHLDVWEHTLLTVTNMARFLQQPAEIFQDLHDDFAPLLHDQHRRARLVFLALIHDMGKPATRTIQDEKVHFYRHEIVGEEMAATLCRRLRVSGEDTRAITRIIRYHLRPLFMMHSLKRGDFSRKAMIKFFDDTGDYFLDIMALALADKTASQGPAAEPDVQDRLRDLYRTLFSFYRDHYRPAIEHPVLTGTVLTQQLHLPAGPQIGELLRRARDLQILGHIDSQPTALGWAEKHAKELF